MAEKQYYEQIEFSKSYLIPYLKKNLPDFEKLKVLEIGCAEAGVMVVLAELNIKSVGVELDKTRADLALQKNPDFKIIVGDISSDTIVDEIGEKFDLIIMREVIEHVPDKISTFKNLAALLNENGYMYMTFPPKYSGFAGHQQVSRSIIRFVPYLHFLPKFLMKILFKIAGEKNSNFPDFIKENYKGLIIESFGTGGIPFENNDIISKVKELVERGMPVVVTTQCLEEGIDFEIYEVGRKLIQSNIIFAKNMNTEAIVAKLMWAVNKGDNLAEVKYLMEEPKMDDCLKYPMQADGLTL